LGGAKLDRYNPDTLGHYIGYLPQDVTLFSGTIAQNIARMADAPDQAAVITAAQSADAHDMIMQLPGGYETILDEGEIRLSGGQRQRIALARALFGHPVLLVLDEPNAMLDGPGTAALNAAVKDFKAQGKAVIILTHRSEAIVECDHILVLKAGRVAAHGPRDKMRKAGLRSDQAPKMTP
jgi:ATP-binding cassette subfamily C protein